MDNNKPNPDDIVIAIMGITGVGKSTFVQYFTTQNVPVSNRLNSCTQDVGVYRCSIPGVPRFFLVDTPGFDDTTRTDSDVLRELAKHLAQAYRSNIKLTGLIYLHRISDNKFGGASGRNLRTFKKLTGSENLGSVVLATTFWQKPFANDDYERETQLNTDANLGWARMLNQKAKYMRQDQNEASAEEILKYLINRRRPVTLKIQRELVDERKEIGQTEAGAEVISDMRRMYEQQMEKFREDMREAMRERDREWQRQLVWEREQREREYEKSQRGLRERLRDWWDDCVVM